MTVLNMIPLFVTCAYGGADREFAYTWIGLGVFVIVVAGVMV